MYLLVRFLYIFYIQNLKCIIYQAELKTMAAEGYTFAKLPKCYLLPQFRDWILYRKGVVFSETDKGVRELRHYFLMLIASCPFFIYLFIFLIFC